MADGEAASRTVFTLLALRLPEALQLVGPLALMLGILMTLAQSATSGELGVMRASGLTPSRLAAPMVLLALVWAGGLLCASTWLAPWSARETAELDARLAEEIVLSGLRPGQFQSLGNGTLSVFVGSADPRSAELRDVFIHRPGPERVEVIRAARGELTIDDASGARLLTLYDGVHLTHAADGVGLPLRRVTFASNAFEVPVPRVDEESGSRRQQQPLSELLGDESIEARREVQWRLAPAVASIVLALLVFPAAVTSPRGGRFGVIVPALVLYLVYTNALNLVLGRVDLDPSGAWVVHGALAAVALLALAWWRRRW